MKKTVKRGEVYEAKTGDVVVVESGGWCYTFDTNSPKVTVKSGGQCYTRDNSSPTVKVKAGGWCETFENSRPKITVKPGGHCEKYGDNRPDDHGGDMKYQCTYISGGGTEYDGGIWDMKETPSKIVLTLTEEPFFELDWTELVIHKNNQKRNRHPILRHDDGTFTVYPYQRGTPYIFEPEVK